MQQSLLYPNNQSVYFSSWIPISFSASGALYIFIGIPLFP